VCGKHCSRLLHPGLLLSGCPWYWVIRLVGLVKIHQQRPTSSLDTPPPFPASFLGEKKPGRAEGEGVLEEHENIVFLIHLDSVRDTAIEMYQKYVRRGGGQQQDLANPNYEVIG